MGQFVARNMLGWFKNINKRISCCILLVVYIAELMTHGHTNIKFDVYNEYSDILGYYVVSTGFSKFVSNPDIVFVRVDSYVHTFTKFCSCILTTPALSDSGKVAVSRYNAVNWPSWLGVSPELLRFRNSTRFICVINKSLSDNSGYCTWEINFLHG